MVKKLLLTTLLVASVCVSIAQTPWSRITPVIQENQINKLYKIPQTNTIIGACENSTIIRSTNNGDDWEVILNPAGLHDTYHFTSIAFTSPFTGFITGSGQSIIKTTDSGSTWEVKFQGLPDPGMEAIKDIGFFDSNCGIAVATDGLVIRTNDGGETWTVSESGFTFDFKEVDIVNDSTAFITGNSKILLKTHDAGITWDSVATPGTFPDGYIEDMIFVNGTTGYVLINYNMPNHFHNIMKTTDGGITWIDSFNQPSVPAYDGYFASFDENHVAIISNTWMYHCKMTITENGGETWQENDFNSLPWYHYGICYTDIDKLLAGGSIGFLSESIDGGNTWNRIDGRQIANNVMNVQFLNNTTGYLSCHSFGGGVAMIHSYKTTDSGLTWSEIGDVYVYFLDSLNGFRVTYSFFEKTTDGGSTWQQILELSEPFAYVGQLKFYDLMNGIITGDNSLMHTIDGGLSWDTISQFSIDYNDIEYRSANEIYIAAGEFGRVTFLLKSEDGGDTWNRSDIGEYGDALDLFFRSPDTAFLACGDRTILRSTDSCETWQLMAVNATEGLFQCRSLSFPDKNTGYAVGGESEYGSLLLKSIDGGTTWNTIEPYTNSPLTCVHFFDTLHGLIFGEQGVILQTNSGGTVDRKDILPDQYYSLFLSPNPFQNEVTMTVPKNNYGSQLIIRDITGRVVKTMTINAAQKVKVNTATFPTGLYFFSIEGVTRFAGKGIKGQF